MVNNMGRMGLSHRVRRQRREYAKLMEENRQKEKQEINAMEMLLGAKWMGAKWMGAKMGGYFYRTSADAQSGMASEYFNREGERITPVEILAYKANKLKWKPRG